MTLTTKEYYFIIFVFMLPTFQEKTTSYQNKNGAESRQRRSTSDDDVYAECAEYKIMKAACDAWDVNNKTTPVCGQGITFKSFCSEKKISTPVPPGDKPVFTACPGDLGVIYAEKNQDYVNMSWSDVVATDSAMNLLNTSQIYGKDNGSLFLEGRHEIVYEATTNDLISEFCYVSFTIKGKIRKMTEGPAKTESFFQTAINETLSAPQAKAKYSIDEKNSEMPKSVSKQMAKLLPSKDNGQTPSVKEGKPMSPVYLRRSKPDRESSTTEGEGDLTKVFTMKKIAKGLITMQKTRQQRLEDTGNITLTRKLRKFEPDVVEKCLSDILEKHLRRLKYDSKRCREVSKSLSEFVRNEVKSMHYPRYRFISVVSIGQLKNASLMLGSRCVWDESQDNFACSSFSNGSIFAVAQVYAVFQE